MDISNLGEDLPFRLSDWRSGYEEVGYLPDISFGINFDDEEDGLTVATKRENGLEAMVRVINEEGRPVVVLFAGEGREPLAVAVLGENEVRVTPGQGCQSHSDEEEEETVYW
jgi:hypothetical protein